MGIPPFDTYLGTDIVRMEHGTAEVGLELGPHHLNQRGVAHGGVIGSLLDTALGAAVVSSMPKEWWCATTSLSTQFIEGPRGGRLTATGRVVRRGSRVAFATGEVRDASGKILATASGTWHLWPYRPGKQRPAGPSELPLRDGRGRVTVGKIVAVGRNYADHVAEMGAPPGDPVLFLKPSSALVPDTGTVRIPRDVGEVHHEVELVVVIGKRGKSIPREEALDHVLGYAVGLDMTLREVQSRAKQRGEPWCVSKGYDGSAPVSRIAPRDEVGDGSGLGITLEVNGELRQQGNTSQMMRAVPDLITFASRWFTLERGDLLFTGTPAGVSPVRPGDRLEAKIDKVGTLTLTAEEEPAGAEN